MDSFRIEWKRSATKELRSLPTHMVTRIVEAVAQLAADPFPPGVRKLAGAEHTYRIREGDYRVVYTVEADQLVVWVVHVGHRSRVSRHLNEDPACTPSRHGHPDRSTREPWRTLKRDGSTR